MGDDQIVAFCRRKYIRPAGDLHFDEIDVIAHSAADGSTCWFQAAGRHGRPLNAERVPPPNEETPPPGHISARAFWQSPAQVAADRCAVTAVADRTAKRLPQSSQSRLV